MELSYRGNHYEYDPTTVAMAEGDMSGKYRGQAWTSPYPRHIPVPSHHHLKYRGVSYCPNPRAAAEAAFAAPCAEETPLRVAATRRNCIPILNEVEAAHLENIRRNLEYRLQVAKDRGDRALIQMLEAESKQLVGNIC